MKENKEKDISFLGRIIYFFRNTFDKIKAMRLPQRLVAHEKKLAGYNDEKPSSERKTAFYFRMIRFFVAILFVVLILSVLLFSGNRFSYENIYYMFKDVSFVSSYSESRPETLNYSKAISNQSFSEFKNGLAVASDSEIKFFTSTGRVTMTQGSEFSNPLILSSYDTSLVYDSGRNSFSLYNSFVQLYSEKLDYPIATADICDDGSFLIVTKSKDYASTVRIYDQSFNLEEEYYKNDRVISARLSDNGKYCAVVSLDAKNGESIVSLNVLKIGSDKLYSSVELSGLMPYECRFLSDDRVMLICSDRMFIYNLRGDIKKEFLYPSELIQVSSDADRCAMLFRGTQLNGDNRIYVFDQNGNSIFNGILNGNISDMIYSNGYVYFLRGEDAVRIPASYIGGEEKILSVGDGARLVGFKNGEILACTSTTAYYLDFN